jgi:hypothetical protein
VDPEAAPQLVPEVEVDLARMHQQLFERLESLGPQKAAFWFLIYVALNGPITDQVRGAAFLLAGDLNPPRRRGRRKRSRQQHLRLQLMAYWALEDAMKAGCSDADIKRGIVSADARAKACGWLDAQGANPGNRLTLDFVKRFRRQHRKLFD